MIVYGVYISHSNGTSMKGLYLEEEEAVKHAKWLAQKENDLAEDWGVFERTGSDIPEWYNEEAMEYIYVCKNEVLYKFVPDTEENQ